MADQAQTPVSSTGPKKPYGLSELVKGPAPGATKPPEEMLFTWPHLVYIEFLAMLFATIVMIVLGLISGAPLEEAASADTTPNPMKAPWYFLGLQELLVFFDPWLAGVVLPGLIIVGLMVIPYIDINPKGIGQYNYRDRKFAVWTFSFGLALWYIFIVIGVYTRGLDWQWYWPWETRDRAIHRESPDLRVHRDFLRGWVYDPVSVLPEVLRVAGFRAVQRDDAVHDDDDVGAVQGDDSFDVQHQVHVDHAVVQDLTRGRKRARHDQAEFGDWGIYCRGYGAHHRVGRRDCQVAGTVV
jgi:hypothetical protein